MPITAISQERRPVMGQAQQKRRAVLIVEDDAELRSLTAALPEDEQLDIIECESAEAALAVMLIGGRDTAMVFADVRLPAPAPFRMPQLMSKAEAALYRLED
jgi:DNA-binding NtrC family response regulator